LASKALSPGCARQRFLRGNREHVRARQRSRFGRFDLAFDIIGDLGLRFQLVPREVDFIDNRDARAGRLHVFLPDLEIDW
jgi:hypothetical protein